MNTMQTILIIFTAAFFTFITRAFPFILFSKTEQPPAIISYLGKILPAAVIAILIIYCMKTINFQSLSSFVPQLIASFIVVLLHLWKRNNLISIGMGTVCYMVMVQFVFT